MSIASGLSGVANLETENISLSFIVQCLFKGKVPNGIENVWVVLRASFLSVTP